ncbi:NFACT family protein [Myxococcota bacterium]|nr:NFACT family protein [Myxococcota bacterium]
MPVFHGIVLALTSDEIAHVVADLAPRVVGAQVQRVWQPAAETLVLAVYGSSGLVFPVLCCAPATARLGEARGKPDAPDGPLGLAQWIRSVALGQAITELRAFPGERIVRLAFPGGAVVAELFGRGANLFGLDEAGLIKVTARPVDASRALRPGAPWAAPPPRPAPGASAGPSSSRFSDARAVEHAARVLEAAAAAEATASERARWFRLAHRRLDRLEAALSRDAAGLQDHEHHRLCGELLSAQLAGLRLPRGATRAVVVNWYEADAPTLEIPLDPALDGPRNVERLFARYRKGRDGLSTVRARQADTVARRVALASLEAESVGLSDDAVAAGLRRLGLAPPTQGGASTPAGAARRPAGPPERLPYRLFMSRAGERILVGRGGADNHALTFRIARGNDFWLHVRDAPGAHVVVPLPARGRAPHPETLLDAAALALHHSDLRGEKLGDITVTERKHVRAAPGGPPGRVTLAAARTLTVTDPAARIERLYAVAERGEAP